MSRIIGRLGSHKEDVVIMGDFNSSADEAPVGPMAARGVVKMLDDIAPVEDLERATRQPGSKRIDYGVCFLGRRSAACRWTKRRATHGGNLFARGRTPANALGQSFETADRRLRRIRIAGEGWATRKALVKSLIVPIFAWMGGYAGLPKADVSKLDTAILRTVLGSDFYGRNRHLAWTTAGPDASAKFSLHWAALRLTMTRARRADHSDASRLHNSTTAWGWSFVDKDRFQTRKHGVISVLEDTVAIVEAVATEAWLDTVADANPLFRAAGRPVERLTQATAAFARAHVGAHGGATAIATAVGAGRDGPRFRHICGPSCDRRCRCGNPEPSIEHLTFECARRPELRLQLPAHPLRARFLIPVAEVPEALGTRSWPEAQLRQATDWLKAAADGAKIIVATDGGAERRRVMTGAAAWAAVFTTKHDRGSPDATFGGLLGGPDRSNWMAESWAVKFVMASAAAASRPDLDLLLVCDCQGIVKILCGLRSPSLEEPRVPEPATLQEQPGL